MPKSRRDFIKKVGTGLIGAGIPVGLPALNSFHIPIETPLSSVPPKQVILENDRFLRDFGKDLQANIFASRKKDHLLVLLLHFETDTGKKESLIGMLKSMAQNSEKQQGFHLTSYQNQIALPADKKRTPGLFCNLYLTADGLKKLGRGTGEWEKIVEHLEQNRQDLAKIKEEVVENNYQSPDRIDAVLMLGHDDEDALTRLNKQLAREIFPRTGVVIEGEEKGRVFRATFGDKNKSTRVVEHFGYPDGLSNPCVTSKQYQKYTDGSKSMSHWNPVCNYQEFVVQEPGALTANSYGSFLVYRKLEQHTEKFQQAIQNLSKRLGISEEEAGAMVFGKRKNGMSLDSDTYPESQDVNDFHYTAQGKCPVFAHSRKSNPRDGDGYGSSKTFAAPNPIIRRGITYGQRKVIYGKLSRLEKPKEPVGMLFMSFQNSITKYHHILGQCMKEELDPLLGDLYQSGKKFQHQIDGLQEPYQGFGGFVSLKGGLNLYAPSIHFFTHLSNV